MPATSALEQDVLGRLVSFKLEDLDTQFGCVGSELPVATAQGVHLVGELVIGQFTASEINNCLASTAPSTGCHPRHQHQAQIRWDVPLVMPLSRCLPNQQCDSLSGAVVDELRRDIGTANAI
jgi:hypothetical protein